MKKIIEEIGDQLRQAFLSAGYHEKYGFATLSNRPDLCEFQCNGAMAAAKEYRKKPLDIAEEIVEKLKDNTMFERVEALAPGFINIILDKAFLSDYLKSLSGRERWGTQNPKTQKIIVDYGGANVAKPLHIGHLRSAIIGEAIKRLGSYLGNEMIGDVHLGDWGLQMGLIIEELRDRRPELSYFDEKHEGEYPKEPPFTLAQLEEIYPAASAKSKEDPEFKERAMLATLKLQSAHPPYIALWKHIMSVSLEDLRKNYRNLNVSFELWKGESDAQPYIPGLCADLEERGIAYHSEGALVVDIREEKDSKELPPCIIRKSDGAALYATSDLATLIEREKLYDPDRYIYVADKRQELHYTQFFRVAKKADIVKREHDLKFIGFGTMNGADGKPFKTRSGGVMRLEQLLEDVENAVSERMRESQGRTSEISAENIKMIGLSAIIYADLSNQAVKDYIFDMDRFTAFEGNTGPYILYTVVRIKSILAKYKEEGGEEPDYRDIMPAEAGSAKALMLELARCNEVIEGAWQELAPHKLCQYIYGIANAFNSFYHEVKILSQEDLQLKKSYLALIMLTKAVLLDCLGILGMEAPERM